MRRWLALIFIMLGLAPVQARAEWLRAESPNFVVYGEGSEARLRDRVTRLENFDALLRLFTGVDAAPSPNRLHVYIVRGEDDLRRIRPLRRGVAGFYSATTNGIAAFVDERADFGANEVLFHEYAHHFMKQYVGDAYPAWYVEGFAEYFQTAEFRDGAINVGKSSRTRNYAIVDQDWLSMERILFGDIEGMTPNEVSHFYAQSWLTTHYFFSSVEGRAMLRRYLAAAREGEPEAALESATGMNADRLAAEIRNYVEGRHVAYRRIGQPAAAAPPITIASLPAAADELMLYHASLDVGLHESLRDEALQAIRTIALRHGDDPFARRVLAHAEALYGDAGAADRLLDPLIAESPNDVELLYLKGMRHLRVAWENTDWESEARAARPWFVRAHRADPNHFQTLFRYAQSLQGEQEIASENTANVMLLAHQLAPQVSGITMGAARLMIGRGDRPFAETLLQPLAADPHNRELADAARQMIARARAPAPAPAEGSASGQDSARLPSETGNR